MSNPKQLPYNLKWGMSNTLFTKTLQKEGFDYDPNFMTFYGFFNWPNCPEVLQDSDIVISTEERTEEDLDLFTMMIFPSDDCYDEADPKVHNYIEADQQAIFDYFKGLYGNYTDEGERDEGDDEMVTLYKAWAFDELFITLAMDKVDPEDSLDQPAFVISLTFSPSEI